MEENCRPLTSSASVGGETEKRSFPDRGRSLRRHSCRFLLLFGKEGDGDFFRLFRAFFDIGEMQSASGIRLADDSLLLAVDKDGIGVAHDVHPGIVDAVFGDVVKAAGAIRPPLVGKIALDRLLILLRGEDEFFDKRVSFRGVEIFVDLVEPTISSPVSSPALAMGSSESELTVTALES